MSIWKLCLLCAAIYGATGVMVNHYVEAMNSDRESLSRRVRTTDPGADVPPGYEQSAPRETSPLPNVEVRKTPAKRSRPRRIEVRTVLEVRSKGESETRSTVERVPAAVAPGPVIVIPVEDSGI